MDQPKLLTMRQFLFLIWLYKRKILKLYCDTSATDIECFNCLQRNKTCTEMGIIPASFFYKKTNRQYYDSKRVLDSLIELDYIEEQTIEGKDYHLYYNITESGINFVEEYQKFYWLFENGKI